MAAPTIESPKPENAGSPKPEYPSPGAAPLRDAGIRLILIPAFGIAIPYLAGYFGPYGPRSPALLGRTRLVDSDFIPGVARQSILPAAPATLLRLVRASAAQDLRAAFRQRLLHRAGGDADDVRVVSRRGLWSRLGALSGHVTLCCVICVMFITHVYETVYLIQQRESDLLAVERLDRARVEAELAALKAQVAPHFLFNSLNTLGWLIERDPRRRSGIQSAPGRGLSLYPGGASARIGSS